MIIRDMVASDEYHWRALWAQYLDFYRTDLPPATTDQTWARIVDPASPLNGRIAEVDGRMKGFALHHTHLSTWAIGQDCYLEDLFVQADARGLGLGRALIDDLIGICRMHGFARLYWHTDQSNTRARALYDQYTQSDGHLRYRINF